MFGSNNLTSSLNGMFGKIATGMCRLSINGDIAVKTSNGYKTYNVNTGRLTNCDNFVFDIGEDFFFVIPTNKVKTGDIILVAGKPRCVVEKNGDKITVINYESNTQEVVLPERHQFMGNFYMYGKIASMFGNNFKGKKSGMKGLMQYMMLGEMLKGGSGSQNVMSNLMPFAMMSMGGGGFEDMFSGMFDFDFDEEDDEDKEDEKEGEDA